MRNLKRAFSLVLALVMVLSVITIAPVAAADETAPATVTSNFTDAAEINYKEAVAITGGIGLFAGADGKFMPKGTVTRAQMATIIVKMLYGGDVNADSFKGSGKFIDTAYFEGGWAEGYINWCSTLGIVAGYGDGTFKPGNQVTTAEAATMILNALKIDAGAGTWPNTVMSKAEEEDFFEDLKPMPGTNTALTREELAVIALNGLNWSDSEEKGWYVEGDSANDKLVFETYKSAQSYAESVGGVVCELKGRDTLASKVYDLKSKTGWIIANQATGEKYTEIAVCDDQGAWTGTELKFNVATDATMIGHKVEVWYKETWNGEKKPGLTYSVSEVAEYITLLEDVKNDKDYKAIFETKYDMDGYVLTNSDGYVSNEAGAVDGYVKGSAAPAGTYVIDNESGELCGYIAPAAVTAAVVDYIDTTVDNEAIHLVGLGEVLTNSEENDIVVEYDGIAKDDLITYTKVQDVYVLTKLTNVAGVMEKYTTRDGVLYITIDGKEYHAFDGTNLIGSSYITDIQEITSNAANFKETYLFYLAPNGTVIGYTEPAGGAVNLAEVVYLLGGVLKTESVGYGKYDAFWYGRGIDLTGNEVMVLLGTNSNTDKNGVGGGTPLVWSGALAADTELGVNDESRFGLVNKGFYAVKEAKDRDAKEKGIRKLEAFPTVYDPENPDQTFVTTYTPGGTGADWAVGGRFEFGVQDRFTGSGAYGGTYANGTGTAYAYPHKGTKFILLEGNANQDEALITSVSTGSVSAYIARQVAVTALVTRQANGTSSVEAAIIPTNIDHAANAAMVYVPRTWDEATHAWGNAKPTGRTSAGNEYDVYDATTGAAKTIVVAKTVTSIEPGFHSISLDAATNQHQLSGVKVPGSTGIALESQNDRTDGRMSENVGYDVTINAYNQSTIWLTYADGKQDNSPCSGAKAIDTRTDEQVANSGVPRITSMDQLWSMMETYKRKATFTVDLCYTSKIVTAYVKVEMLSGAETVYGNTIVDGPTLPAGIDTVYDPSGRVTAANFATLAASNLIAYEISDSAFDGRVLKVTGIFVKDAEESNSAADGLPAVVTQVIDQRDVAEADKITMDNLADKAVANAISYYTYRDSGVTVLEVTGVVAGTRVNGTSSVATTALNALTGTVEVVNEADGNTYTVSDLVAQAAGKSLAFTTYQLSADKAIVVLHDIGAYTAISATSAITAPGSYQLSGDVTGALNLTAAGTYTLNLNGKTLTNTTAPFITVGSGVTLIIKDTGATGTIQGISNGTDAMIKVDAGGTLTLEGGLLTEHTSGANAGAIFAKGTVNMYGGEISDNTCTGGKGGAIGAAEDTARVNIYGGKLLNNTAIRGGSICMGDDAKDSQLTISGGEIRGNTSTESATYGSIYSHTGNFVISGGTIADTIYWRFGTSRANVISGNPVIGSLTLANDAVASIGNLTYGASITTASALTVTDGTVVKTSTGYEYGTASGEGPSTPVGITINQNTFDGSTTVTLSGDTTLSGSISLTDGKAHTLNLGEYDLSGSAGTYITIGSGTTLTINGTGTITGNSSTKSMIKVLTGGTLVLAGGTLQGHNGDLVEVAPYGKFTMSGGVIDGTVADNSNEEAAGYTVTYAAGGDGVTGLPADQFKGKDVALTLGAAPSRTGYKFMGWSDGTNTYEAGASYEENAAATMTAVWEELTYTVKYDLKNGEGQDGFTFDNQTKEYFSDLDLYTEVPVQEGCTFKGWSFTDGGAVAIQPGASYTYTENKPLTLYAVWVLAEYDVELYDGSDLEDTLTKKHNIDLSLTVLPDSGNKYFMGWAESSSATTPDYAVGEKFDENGLNNGDTFKLYAVWGTYVPLSGTTSGATQWGASERYQLTGDWTLGGSVNIKNGAEVVLDLNGYTVSMPSTDGVYFNILADSKLTIKDSAGDGKVQFKTTAGGSPGIQNSGTFVLEGGELNGWKRSGAGGCVYLYEGTTFIMTGGKITDCSAASYSVIRTAGGGHTVTITGGTITGNNVTNNSSVIGITTASAAKPSTVTIGGTADITGNTVQGAAYTEANHYFAANNAMYEIQCVEATVTIKDNAKVGSLYNRGANNIDSGNFYSSISVSGAPTVGGIRWSSSNQTLVTIKNLDEGASIKIRSVLSNSLMDNTVKVSGPNENSAYTYTYIND